MQYDGGSDAHRRTIPRAAALRTSLGAVVRHHPCGRGPRLVISQDAGGGPRWREARAEIDAAAAALGRRCPSLERTRVVTQPDDGKGGDGYHRLARHFRKALAEAFADARTSRVIVLEEDLEIAPDFFGFFSDWAVLVLGSYCWEQGVEKTKNRAQAVTTCWCRKAPHLSAMCCLHRLVS